VWSFNPSEQSPVGRGPRRGSTWRRSIESASRNDAKVRRQRRLVGLVSDRPRNTYTLVRSITMFAPGQTGGHYSARCRRAPRRPRAAGRAAPPVPRRRVPLRHVRQLACALQPEHLQEQRRRAVHDGAELRASLSSIRPRSSSDATGESALTPRIRAISGARPAPVGDDRERLELGRRERASRGLASSARGTLGDRVAGQRVAAGQLAQHEAALAGAQVSASSSSAAPTAAAPSPGPRRARPPRPGRWPGTAAPR